jgi:YbbR domain-containing protein
MDKKLKHSLWSTVTFFVLSFCLYLLISYSNVRNKIPEQYRPTYTLPFVNALLTSIIWGILMYFFVYRK